MRISATGTSTPNSPWRRQAGFTLIEILVVVLIIGIMVVGAMLSIRITGNDGDLDKERDRVLALTSYQRDQAALQNRNFGMRVFEGGYEFLVYNSRTGLWKRLEGDATTKPRTLPPGVEISLLVEARPVVLPPSEVEDDELQPQIMLFATGELSEFQLTLQRKGGVGMQFSPSSTSDRIDVTELTANRI